MNLEIRNKIKTCLREHLLGKDNQNKREALKEALGISDSTIKSWTSQNENKIPVTEDIPTLTEILGISFYEFYGMKAPNSFNEKEILLVKAYNSHINEQPIIDKILDIKKD